MNDGKYYLMDMLDIKALGTKFIAGYDYTTNGDKVKTARFIFVQVVPRGTRIGYFIAGIDINFENGTCLTMIRNLTDIKDIENEKEAESKMMRIINMMIIQNLLIACIQLLKI